MWSIPRPGPPSHGAACARHALGWAGAGQVISEIPKHSEAKRPAGFPLRRFLVRKRGFGFSKTVELKEGPLPW